MRKGVILTILLSYTSDLMQREINVGWRVGVVESVCCTLLAKKLDFQKHVSTKVKDGMLKQEE